MVVGAKGCGGCQGEKVMVGRRRDATLIAEGLKIAGSVEAEGSVELHGKIEGELHCTSLHVAEKGQINGKIVAEDVTVNGTVEGPIYGTDVKLEPNARVTGDVHHESFAIEKGAFFDGRSKQKDKPSKEKLAKKETAPKINGGSAPKANETIKADQTKSPTAA
jgi:cytoskeletal protein CcmA (bactofilin family)